jgi:rhodanese-related sulfurtransferase
MRWKVLAAALLFATGAGAMLVGHPDLDRKLAWAEAELNHRIESRDYHIDPAELLELMWNNQIRLALLDVRDEADYNLFHLIDARRFAFTDADMRWSENLPDETVRVVLSNDEARAEDAWKKLTVLDVPNVYVLAGGVNAWLRLCKPHKAAAARLEPVHLLRPDAGRLGEEQLKYTFPAALGDRYPEARPPADCFADRGYQKKVTVLKPVTVPAGGCGG